MRHETLRSCQAREQATTEAFLPDLFKEEGT